MTNRAVTLIEIVMVIVIIGALSGGVAVFVNQGVDIWNFVTFRNDEVSQARVAIDRMVREIRQIKDKGSVFVATANDLSFTAYYDTNADGVSEDVAIEYTLSGGNLLRNSDILSDHVSSLAFQYYDTNSALLATPQVSPGDTNMRRVVISLTVTSGDQQISMKSQVFPRNF